MIYVPLVLAEIVVVPVVGDQNVIVPVPLNFVRWYPDIPAVASNPVAVVINIVFL
jgi:hypothetical protein